MRPTLFLIFLFSGASALIFESLWFRLAGLSLGNSVWSASLVLAAFMGGLALGNGLLARFEKHVIRPVRLYAALEIAIGVGGIAVVLILPWLPRVLGPVLGGLVDMPVALNTVRLSIAFAFLVIPAIAMGATLPVLAKALSRQYPNFGANIGWLYGWNTCGAMLGAISTELVLVPSLGILGTGLAAFAFNLLAALIALQVSQAHEEASTAHAEEPETTAAPEAGSRRSNARFIAVAFLSGTLMLALEVVWFRFLLLTQDGTSLIFSVMLAIVLGGIAVGGLVAALLFQRDEKAYRWLRHVTAASATLVVFTYWGYDQFSVYDIRKDTTTIAFIGYSIFLMLPVAFLSGIAFTMVSRAVKDGLGPSARTAGIASLFNTTGAMLGSLAAGFILLPVLGMELSFFLVAAVYCLVALVVPIDKAASRDTIRWGRVVVAGAFACLLAFPFGLMNDTYFNSDIAKDARLRLIETREGLTETIRYFSHDLFGQPKYYRLVTNAHSMSGTTTAAKRYMKLYVYLPLALNPDTRDTLLISYGVGSTAKALTDSGSLERIDIVDISEDILEMNDIVYPGDDNPLRDGRVSVHVEDGRFFLNTTDIHYDLITSEPPPPKNAGVVNLYTQEYFELIRTRLNPGGYTSYWLPVTQLLPTDTLAIIKAFCNAFDDCSLWSGAGLEWMLLGSNGAAGQVDTEKFSAQWRNPLVRDELLALGFESPAQLGSLFMADSVLLTALTTDVPPVTDNYPSRISSRSGLNQGYVEMYDRLMDEGQRLQRFRQSGLIASLWPADLRSPSEAYFQYERMIKNHLTGGVYQKSSDPYLWDAIDLLLNDTTLQTLPLWLLGSDRATHEIVARLTGQGEYRDEFALEIARKYTVERDYATALRYMNDYISSVDGIPESAANLHLYLLARNGLIAEARPYIDILESIESPGMTRFLEWYETTFASGSGGNHGPGTAEGEAAPSTSVNPDTQQAATGLRR